MEIVFKDESYQIIGACFEVYKEKGSGFLEAVHQECLEIEMEMRAIPFRTQADLKMSYKGRPLKQRYTPDFICYESIIVEIKAVSMLIAEHRAQVHNYLKATGYKLGILVNFAHFPQLEWERVVR
jgi:GxxExxY protein